MDNLEYRVKLELDDDGGFTVTFPDMPGAITEGDNQEQALARAVDALETILAAHIRDGSDIPTPGAKGRGPIVRPSPLSRMKLAVYQSMRNQGVGKAELARRLNWHLPQVDRVLDLRHSSRVDQIEAALGALGLVMRIDVEKAA
jgi:antitoxin HicB